MLHQLSSGNNDNAEEANFANKKRQLSPPIGVGKLKSRGFMKMELSDKRIIQFLENDSVFYESGNRIDSHLHIRFLVSTSFMSIYIG